MFVDRVAIHVEAGRGGNGSVSFRREKFVPKGGPDGGDGGRGGDVILRMDSRIKTLLDFHNQASYRATKGVAGSGNNRTGKNGEDLVIRVPPGTVVLDSAAGIVLADLVEPGTEVAVARGGRGGRGNARFATSTRQAPRIAEPGGEGEARDLVLELRLIADVGLVGQPNAGKSTLLSTVSAARPKIGDYPFTTRRPHLGIVQVDDASFVMADIPGLIEGAHEGKGLGLDFLRHISRTRVLCVLIDATTDDHPRTLDLLLHELTCYDPHLTARPRVVCLTKADVLQNDEMERRVAAVRRARPAETVFAISAVTGAGISDLLRRLFTLTAAATPPGDDSAGDRAARSASLSEQRT